MARLVWVWVWVWLPALVGASVAHAEDDVAPRRVALVFGVSSYARLPGEVALETPRTEAARVAAALEQGAGFDQVRLLTDASATTANVQDVLREQFAKEVHWRDLFLLYFVGHGVGGDFGDPRLLFYDTDPDALEATSLSVADLASLLQKFVPASQYVVVTDAAHAGTLNGLSLLGPSGNDWPQLGNQSFVVSSAAPRQVTTPGVFARAFVEAMSGQADTNADGMVSGSELNNYLVVAVPNATGGAQLPTVQSTYTPTMTVAARPKPAEVAPSAPVAIVDKIKVNFQGVTKSSVTCGAAAPVVCDPSCYLWEVPAATCDVRASSEGAELVGALPVVYRGAYTCGVYEGAVRCSSPPPP